MERMNCEHCRQTGLEYPDCEPCQGMGFVVDEETMTIQDCPECENEPCNECSVIT